MRSKSEMLAELKKMLHDMFVAREAGTAHHRMARAHGYVDGYMRGLIDGGHASRTELLALVAEARAAVYGPATAKVELETAAA